MFLFDSKQQREREGRREGKREREGREEGGKEREEGTEGGKKGERDGESEICTGKRRQSDKRILDSVRAFVSLHVRECEFVSLGTETFFPVMLEFTTLDRFVYLCVVLGMVV